ncbi:MAG: hypothetical protein SFX73_32505 [Kofleriaceae bacterium]|nr:hypothetical protein [Kofleriaceae bacterium]
MRRFWLGGLLALASCGRFEFDSAPPRDGGSTVDDDAPDAPPPALTSTLRLVAGVTSVDVEVCTSRSARIVHVVTTEAWPPAWDRAYLEQQIADGSTILATDEREQATGGCATITHKGFTQDRLALNVYAVADVASTGERDQQTAAGALQPMLEQVSYDIAGHTQRYWIHKPESYYRDPAAPLPVLLFLAGSGEDGNDAGVNFTLMPNRGLLSSFTQRRAAVVELPFLVVAPQCNTDRATCWGWIGQMANLDEVLAHVRPSYTFVDERIYVTGLSTGGEGAWRYAIYSRARPGGPAMAAAVPIAATYTDATWYNNNLCTMSPVPVWAFHNSDDPTQPVTNSRTLVSQLAACPTSPTVAPQLDEGTGGHNAWSNVYNGTHAFTNDGESSVYAWLLSFTL